ncbi:hypothetical protein J4526_02590 [Desulfurococcaceae archaeon MEX13E-LK6-19]|nr:hypothetical protein J4526_02590 [Desulfurococcaceae archaeon MEX13E-LK6-19]
MGKQGKRWIKKREFMVYYFIYKTIGCNKSVNIGELLDLITSTFGFNRKTSLNIIKHLIRIGLLKKQEPMVVSPRCINEVLDSYLEDYISSRKKRLQKK